MSVQDLLNYIALQGEGFSRSVSEDIDGNVLERLEYLANRAGGAKKVSGSGYQVYPAAAVGVDPSLTSGSWANNSWAQVVASTAAAIYLVGVKFNTASAGTSIFVVEFELDIGTGGAGSETVVSTLPGHVISYTNDRDKGAVYLLPYPVAVASGTRIAVRTRLANATWGPNDVKLLYVNQSDLVAL